MGEFIYNLGVIQKVLSKRREWRCKFILSKVQLAQEMFILDVGCGSNGRSFENFIPDTYKIIGIDLISEDLIKFEHKNFTYLKHDAQDLSLFSDKQFDLTVSIGMMEHICNHAILEKMAKEIERVSKQFVIVVPWKFAIIEPHFKFPFFSLLPYKLQVFLTKTLNLHNLKGQVLADDLYIKRHYQWFPSKKWKEIFQGSRVFVLPTLDTIAIVKSLKAR
ncbi:MAG: class I SAM-dependent methyltransferase [Desulfobulbus sp.]